MEDTVALFAPCVQVVEVLPKSNFLSVNIRDPEGAKRAREALNGSLSPNKHSVFSISSHAVQLLYVKLV